MENVLEAHYNAVNYWDLDELGLDLKNVKDWYVVGNVLHVQRKEGDTHEEFESEWEPDFDHKHPTRLFLNDAEATPLAMKK